MKKNMLKILMIVTAMVCFGFGVALADDCGYPRGRAYGHYRQGGHPYYHHAPPRPVYVEHHYRPVVVERHYYREPVRYLAPAPRGFFFGMSVANAGAAFSFGASGR